MGNVLDFKGFLFEWIDSPGSIDVPGQSSEIQVNSRNYKPAHQELPMVVDPMFEANEIYGFLDEYGNSIEFNEFLKNKPKPREITDHIKEEIRKIKNK